MTRKRFKEKKVPCCNFKLDDYLVTFGTVGFWELQADENPAR